MKYVLALPLDYCFPVPSCASWKISPLRSLFRRQTPSGQYMPRLRCSIQRIVSAGWAERMTLVRRANSVSS
jgi:hypothetical protein